jgi:hypothetical protein
MSANSLSPTPLTPFPDPPSHSGEEPTDLTAQPPAFPEPQNAPKPSTSSADDLALLLGQTAPDPYLDGDTGEIAGPPGMPGAGMALPADPGKPLAAIDGGEPDSSPASLSSSENELQNIALTPPPDTQPRPASSQPAASSSKPVVRTEEEEVEEVEATRVSWPFLLVSSYASAVTLAICWILWTGRGLSRPDSTASPEPVPGINGSSPSQGASLTGDGLMPLPAPKVTDLGRPVRLGELEVIPRSIVRRSVDLLRLQGTAEGQRESSPTLVMTLELTNRSTTSKFSPLDPAIVRDPVPAVDQSFIEVPGGRRIAMFRLATESEWSIQDQVFPALQPGETAETILVSEPVAMSDLAGTMTWRVKLRTETFRTDVLGIRFSVEDVIDRSF